MRSMTEGGLAASTAPCGKGPLRRFAPPPPQRGEEKKKEYHAIPCAFRAMMMAPSMASAFGATRAVFTSASR